MKRAVMVFASLSILLLGIHSQAAGEQPQTAASLPWLIAALSDGPLQVRPAAHLRGTVTAQAATLAATKAIGTNFQAAQAWPVTFTDRENLSRPGVNLPCWLVASSRAFTLPLVDEAGPLGMPRRETLYVVINARTGILVDAFSKPRAAWWRRVVLTNAAYLRSGSGFQTAIPANAPPHLPLTGPFTLSGTRTHSDLAAYFFGKKRADQFIARYFIYTDRGSTVPTHLTSGPANKFEFLRQPVWAVFLEGLNTPIGGPVQLFAPPLPPHEPGTVRFPRQEELSTVINATTGESFDVSVSRDGRQVDLF